MREKPLSQLRAEIIAGVVAITLGALLVYVASSWL
jgi:hypothetical protein